MTDGPARTEHGTTAPDDGFPNPFAPPSGPVPGAVTAPHAAPAAGAAAAGPATALPAGAEPVTSPAASGDGTSGARGQDATRRPADPFLGVDPWVPTHDVARARASTQGLGPTPADPARPHAGAPTRDPGTPIPAAPAPPPQPLRAARRRRRVPVALVAVLLVLAFAAGACGGALADWWRQRDGHLTDAGLPVAATGASTGRAPGSVAAIAAQVLPSVVSIEVTTAEGSATGSGVVLRQDGYVLTNHHVVADSGAPGASTVVLFADGSQQPATVVGSTSDYDLAVLKVDVTGLVPLVLGDSDAVQVGDPVVAVGAPLGLAGTVTEGIVSALNRPVAAGAGPDDTAFINAIQTDAAINPGNSGGPLVNAAGEVVGINSAIAQPPGVSTSSGGSIGLGFAIPSNQARRTAEQLIESGVATYPVIGVLLDSTYTGEGVQVATAPQGGTPAVTPEGPADRAGIRAGDVILAIDGRPVTASDELVVAIRARTPGDAVVLRVRTDGEERDVRVVLDESAPG